MAIPGYYLEEVFTAPAAYIYTLTKNPPAPNFTPQEYFGPPEAGEFDLRLIDAKRFYGRMHLGRPHRFSRDEMFNMLGTELLTSEGRLAWLDQLASERIRPTNLAPGKHPLKRAISNGMIQLFEDQKHVLHWSFAQENLYVQAELKDGTVRPLSTYWIPEREDGAEEQSNGSAPVVADAPIKNKVGRPTLTLNAERREIGKAGRALLAEGKPKAEVARILGHDKGTIDAYIDLLVEEEIQPVKRLE